MVKKIIYKQDGDIFNEEVEAIVNTVNTQGYMGKGIAKQFKQRYKKNDEQYQNKCSNGELQAGELFIYEHDPSTNRRNQEPEQDVFGNHTPSKDITTNKKITIINFATKKEFRYPSKKEYIENGLQQLQKEIKERNITSIAMPSLGCGNGGLVWKDVKNMINHYLADLADDCKIIVFEPQQHIS